MTDEVQDQRQPGWFWLDNEVLETYGPKIGMNGVAVYCALLKFAKRDSTGEGSCYPAVPTIAKMLDSTAPTVRKTLYKLQEHGLITIIERIEDNHNQTNLYLINPVNKTSNAGGTKNSLVPPKNSLVGVRKNIEGGTKNSFHEQDPYNNTHMNKTTTVGSGKGLTPEKENSPVAEAQALYVRESGDTGPMAMEIVKELVEEYSFDWFVKAYRLSRESGKMARDLKYVRGILRRSKDEGHEPRDKNNKPANVVKMPVKSGDEIPYYVSRDCIQEEPIDWSKYSNYPWAQQRLAH